MAANVDSITPPVKQWLLVGGPGNGLKVLHEAGVFTASLPDPAVPEKVHYYAGKVIELRPVSDPAPRDSEVDVVVSKGPDLVKVPSVRGMSLEEAVQAIEAAGLEVGDAFGPAKGKPFLTDPPAGTEVRRGETVDIYLRK